MNGPNGGTLRLIRDEGGTEPLIAYQMAETQERASKAGSLWRGERPGHGPVNRIMPAMTAAGARDATRSGIGNDATSPGHRTREADPACLVATIGSWTRNVVTEPGILQKVSGRSVSRVDNRP